MMKTGVTEIETNMLGERKFNHREFKLTNKNKEKTI